MLRTLSARMVACALLVCAVACSGGWVAFASPEAAAVWNGNFSKGIDGFALDKIGVTSAADNSYVTIGATDNKNQGLLVNFPSSYDRITVLVRYANFTVDETKTNVLFVATRNSAQQYNTYGVWLRPDGAVAGFYNSNNNSSPNHNVEEKNTAATLDIATAGKLAFVYDKSGGISAYASVDGEFSELNSWAATSLYEEAMYGISVGGHCGGDYADGAQSAIGMTISGLAVFTNALDVAQMNAYSWPTETSTTNDEPENSEGPEGAGDAQDPGGTQGSGESQGAGDAQDPSGQQGSGGQQGSSAPEDVERFPVAVWDGDFSQSALTKFAGFTLVDDQQTHGENSSSVTIDQDNQGLLVDFDEKHSSFTVLVKYSNLVANDLLHRVVFATTANDTNQYDRVGVRLTGDGKLTGFENESLVSGDYDMPYTNDVTGTQKFYTNGTLAVIYDMRDKGGLYVYAASTDGVFPAEEAWGAPDITRGCMTGFSVGGMCRGAGNMLGVEAAKGMTITGLAVFTNALTVAEMNAFDWRETTPSATDTEFPAPYFWIDMYFPDLVSGWSSAQYNDFATNKNHSSVKNGYAPWESYVLGLDPTNEISKLKVLIRMDGERPVVEYSPTNEELKASGDIKYVLQGKPTLNNDWQDVDFNEPGDTNHFFRVKVIW